MTCYFITSQLNSMFNTKCYEIHKQYVLREFNAFKKQSHTLYNNRIKLFQI